VVPREFTFVGLAQIVGADLVLGMTPPVWSMRASHIGTPAGRTMGVVIRMDGYALHGVHVPAGGWIEGLKSGSRAPLSSAPPKGEQNSLRSRLLPNQQVCLGNFPTGAIRERERRQLVSLS
jgi:hypothetical protein